MRHSDEENSLNKVACPIFLSFLALLPWMPNIALAESIQIPPPRSFSFDVSRGGSTLDIEFQIRQHRNYYFALQFDYAGEKDLYRVLKLAGGGSRYPDGRYGEPGVVVPVQLKIFRVSGEANPEAIFNETIETQGSYAHQFSEQKFHGHYMRMIAVVALKPGLYRVHINTMKDRPEFLGTPSRVKIEWHSNERPLDK